VLAQIGVFEAQTPRDAVRQPCNPDDDELNITGTDPMDEDTDDDGFIDGVEAYIGTDPLDDCPDDSADDAWPFDININTWSDILDVLQYRDHLQICVGQPGYVQRLDLNADLWVDILDVLLYKGHLQVQCTNP
jgi:hypothetical protein